MNYVVRPWFILFLLSIFYFSLPGVSGELRSCSICGMEIKETLKSAFESERDGKVIHFCSYACASGFRKKYSEVPLFAHDFNTNEKIDVSKAFFLIDSSNLLKEIEFGMEPTVVAFAGEATAKKTQARLKDGKVIEGYDALKKLYR